VDATAKARRGDLQLDLEPASDPTVALLIPNRLVREEFVFVALAICGESAACN
jgi:hypothetical protein